jgi:DNA-binding NtrC family response regulator
MATHVLNGRNDDREFSSKIEALRVTVRSLLHEATGRTPPLDIDPETGTDFYEAVARFETQLIELALQMSGGRQNKAAKLLHLRTSTLNWKMKKLDIK